MPSPLDIAFAALFTIAVPLLEYYVFWPRLKRRLHSGAADARLGAYRRITIGEWLFAGAAIALWVAEHRSWQALGLVPAAGWRVAAGLGVGCGALGIAAVQVVLVRRASAEERATLRPRLGPYLFLLPRTIGETRLFAFLSLTAGVCEELLYRGFLVWLLRPWLGLYGAAALSVVAFGLGHSYQGPTGAVRATIAGAVLGAIVLVSGWLVPAMIVHAAIDASSGTIGFMVLRDDASFP